MTGPHFTAQISHVKQVGVSSSGIPTFDVTFSNGMRCRTKSNATYAHSLAGREYLSSPVEVYLTRAGKIDKLIPRWFEQLMLEL